MRRLLRALRLPRTDRRHQRGVALVMAIATLGLITYLAMEVTYESTVEYTVNAQALNRIKAYYAAKSGLEVSLLRIKVYQTIMSKYGDKLGPFAQYVDEIWRFPFMWPMTLPAELNEVDKESADKLVKQSSMDATFQTDIQDEGSKLDLADLVSPSKTLRELTHKRLVDVLKQKVETDDEWRNKYGAYRFDELINNIGDWMSDKKSSLNGGDKASAYAELNKDGDDFPPNRGFRTLQEMRMVKDMNDDFFDVLAPQVTIYGMRGVNPNVASKDVLKSLDPGITDQVADEIEKFRSDPAKGGWKSADDFWAFVTSPPANAQLQNKDYKNIPLYFEALISFRIKSTGEFGGAKREISVIVTDLDRTASRIKEYVDKDKKNEGASDQPKDQPPAEGTKKAAANNPLPKGPPRIVYWTER